MLDRIKLQVKGISEIIGAEDMALLVLVDEADERQLIVPCDNLVAQQVKTRLFKYPNRDELLPEVMWNFFSQATYIQAEIFIYGFHDGVYFTTLMDTLTGKTVKIRCSDAVLLSVVTNIPIYVTRKVMLSNSEPFQPNRNKVALPINIISETLLKKSMQEAIESENYEMAINLRDELKRREELKQRSNSNDKLEK